MLRISGRFTLFGYLSWFGSFYRLQNGTGWVLRIGPFSLYRWADGDED